MFGVMLIPFVQRWQLQNASLTRGTRAERFAGHLRCSHESRLAHGKLAHPEGASPSEVEVEALN